MKMNPPVREEDDRVALVDALRSGAIDCVATDHAPHASDEKEVPFEEAAVGTTGLETAFAVLHTGLVVPGLLTLGTLVDRMSAGAALMDLPVPRVAVGEPATCASSTSRPSGRWGRPATRAARTTAASPARASRAGSS